MIRVELSAQADADLAAILNYSREKYGWDVAETYLRDIARSLERLSDYPELGAIRHDLRQKPRCLPCREHHIFYRIDHERLFVGRVLHKAMDAQRWLA